MIKYNGIKMTAKEAAIHLMLDRLQSIGYSTDEREMILSMSAKELDSFFREYSSNYNKISVKVGADSVDSATLLATTLHRVLTP